MPIGTGFGQANAIGISTALVASLSAAVYKVTNFFVMASFKFESNEFVTP